MFNIAIDYQPDGNQFKCISTISDMSQKKKYFYFESNDNRFKAIDSLELVVCTYLQGRTHVQNMWGDRPRSDSNFPKEW